MRRDLFNKLWLVVVLLLVAGGFLALLAVRLASGAD